MKRLFFASSLASATVAALLATSSTAMASDWSHLESTDGVDVYERSARQLGDQNLRAVVEIDAPIGEVMTVFVDPDERTEWKYRMDDQEILDVDKRSETAWMERYWTRIDMPFPVSDRDYVMAKEYRIDDEHKRVMARARSVDDDRKPSYDSCCVRALSVMQYTLEPVDGEESTRVEMVIETDLKGNLSSGRLVRSNAPDWPIGTLKRLAERVENGDAAVDERVADWHE